MLVDEIRQNETNTYLLKYEYTKSISQLILSSRNISETNRRNHWKAKIKAIECIRADHLKDVANKIAVPPTYVINLSFNSGIFPDCFKTVVVNPIYSSGDKLSVTNYRPISLVLIYQKFLKKFWKLFLLVI